jgi:GGDEF domain-containing protein
VSRALPGVRVSIGVALPRPGEVDSEVLARADRALYAVKPRGRDGVALAPDEPPHAEPVAG